MATFKDNDIGLANIKMAVSAAKTTNMILEKYGKITPKLPLSVPHLLVYGPAGCGKTTRVEEAAKLMGCHEGDNSFIRISAECVNTIAELIYLLVSKLSWQGYECNYGNTDHCHCPKDNHHIIDPINPKAPVKPQLVFFDEIHVLPSELQEKLGLILLDFRYQLRTDNGTKTFYFPRFTFAGATTKPGELLKPLRTRFGIKVNVDYLNDEDMTEVVNSMVANRGWNVAPEAIEIIAKIAQGIPREADNHLTGLFNCWAYNLETLQTTNKCSITKDIAERYIEVQQFNEDGLSYSQLGVLKYLASLSKGTKRPGIGVTRICSALGCDEGRYLDEIEPRLVFKGFIVAGGRGREISEQGLDYIKTKFPK